MQMTNDLARVILLAGFVLVMPIGIYHRMRAHTDEKLDRSEEGWLILLTLRPLALASLLGLIVFLIHPRWMEWSAVQLPSWMRWCGVAFGIGAGALMIWTFRCLGRNLTDTVVIRRDAVLITHGPYRWVRHPFYLAFALVIAANTLVTANAFVGITGIGAFLAIAARTSIEERKLTEKFGSDYQDYVARTGRFFPKFRRISDAFSR